MRTQPAYIIVGLLVVLVLTSYSRIHPLDGTQQFARAVGLSKAVLEEARQQARPALHLEHTQEDRSSWIGGDPRVPPDFKWPSWQGRPMTFLAQMDLSEVAAALREPWFPTHGQLYFFHASGDPELGDEPTERGSWRVIYSRAERSTLTAPNSGSRDMRVFPRTNVTFRRIESLPSEERVMNGREPTNEEFETLLAAQDAPFKGHPRHQMFGYPVPEQNDNMELESELALRGLTYADEGSNEYRDATREAAQWHLLLQLDTDDDLQMMWEDGGLLFFWIKQTDAAQGNFDRVWMVLQSG